MFKYLRVAQTTKSPPQNNLPFEKAVPYLVDRPQDVDVEGTSSWALKQHYSRIAGLARQYPGLFLCEVRLIPRVPSLPSLIVTDGRSCSLIFVGQTVKEEGEPREKGLIAGSIHLRDHEAAQCCLDFSKMVDILSVTAPKALLLHAGDLSEGEDETK
jgi:hypothetical protein